MKRYVKKAIVIEAVQYHKERIGDILDFVPQECISYNPEDNEYYIKTLEGNMKISENDYVIKGVSGEFYPCKPDIFEKTYEAVE